MYLCIADIGNYVISNNVHVYISKAKMCDINELHHLLLKDEPN